MDEVNPCRQKDTSFHPQAVISAMQTVHHPTNSASYSMHGIRTMDGLHFIHFALYTSQGDTICLYIFFVSEAGCR